MAGLTYNNALTSGHSAYPPTKLISTQSKVFVDGIPVVVEGDKIVPHTKTVDPHDTHDGVIQPRTNKVFVDGKKAGQMADPISCGDTVSQSSNKTFIK